MAESSVKDRRKPIYRREETVAGGQREAEEERSEGSIDRRGRGAVLFIGNGHSLNPCDFPINPLFVSASQSGFCSL